MTQRTRRRLTVEFILIAALIGVMLGYWIPGVLATGADSFSFVDRLVDVHSQIARYYVNQPDEEKLTEGAINGMVDTLGDKYTLYFTAEELAGFETITTGTFSGIGAEIEQRDNHIAVVAPIEDSPAYKAGILCGDLILAVNGESLENVSTEEAVKKITGEEGTPVTLRIRRSGEADHDITIIRAKVKIATIRGIDRDAAGHWHYLLDAEHHIGYIRMTQFSEPTYDALVAAIGELKARGPINGLILDLRYNPGGLLDSAVKIGDLFLPSGVIVSTRGRASPERKWEAEKDGTLPDFPMIVLVNGGSASASEILAGALKYNNRAIILGERSVGKGSVQQIIPLDKGAGGIKLTTALYYMPNGQNIHRLPNAERWGVDPTDGFYVPMTFDQQKKMVEVRRDNNIHLPADGKVSPEWINEHLADPQLAAAMKSMIVKLGTGEFEKVGPGDANLFTHIARKDNLEREKIRLREGIGKIDEELAKEEKILETGTPGSNTPETASSKPEQSDPLGPPASAGGESPAPAIPAPQAQPQPAAP
ncbi:MAG: S41 family peptidase [Phycisphaerales bacterium]